MDVNAITDIDVLRALVREQIDVIAQHEASLADHVAAIAQRDRTITYKDAKIAHLTHEIARLRRLQYAAKSERMDPAQRELFEAAMAADIAALEAELEDLRSPAGTNRAAQRGTPQRRALPAGLPRIETIHEPQSCDCATCGAALVKIGEHVSEKLDVEPLRFFVRREVHPVIPPRVDYSLTPLGQEVAAHVEALTDWIEGNLDRVLRAREKAPARARARSTA